MEVIKNVKCRVCKKGYKASFDENFYCLDCKKKYEDCHYCNGIGVNKLGQICHWCNGNGYLEKRIK